ncbi:MAG: alkaline phosphatase D family protein [Flavobacteriales bacterium]|nr:alkaline phosphatase D family protein [Flavobacteriales bacterium]
MKQFLSLVFFLIPYFLFSQSITSSPVVGGLTSETARIYIRTNVPTDFDIELDTLTDFATSFFISDSTRSDRFATVIAEIEGLQPFKEYYYRFLINGQPQDSVYSFTSFPEEGHLGHYKIVVGSCNYFENFPLFGHIKAFDPMLFIHLGDWKYPPSTFGWDYNLYPDRIANAFSWCYNDANMSGYVLNNTAIDYVYDDSYCHNGNQGATHPRTAISQLPNGQQFYDLQTVHFDEGVIPGAINGYFDNFPGYEAVDTAIGVHHSFKLGNMEFFMLDLRNSATPQNEPYIYHPETNMYTFEPGPNHSLMSAGQRQWLLDGLLNSTANWKIIGSSVMFNKRLVQFREVATQLQALEPSMIDYASNLSYMWNAYPADQNTLLDFVEQNNLKDVIVISGDSHSSMVDDGTNAGLPELSASGLTSEDEGYMNFELDSVIDLIGYTYGTIDSLWNGGGNGVDNNNFSDSYGTMEVFGKDSMRLCAMDELGQEMGCIIIYHSSSPMGIHSAKSPSEERLFLAYPNPSKDAIRVEFRNGYAPSKNATMQLSSISGETIQIWSGNQIQNQMSIDLSKLSAGNYTLTYLDENKMDTRKIVVSD